jgi:hypothetical protein
MQLDTHIMPVEVAFPIHLQFYNINNAYAAVLWTSAVGVRSIIQPFFSAFCKAVLWKIMTIYLVRKLLQFFSSFLLLNYNWNNLYSCKLNINAVNSYYWSTTGSGHTDNRPLNLEMPSWKWGKLSEGHKWDMTQSVAAPVSRHEFIVVYVLLKKVTSEHRKSSHVNPCEVLVSRARN